MGLQLMNGYICRINPISGFCRHFLSARYKLPLHIDEKGVKQSVADKFNLPIKPKKPLSPFFRFMLQIRPKLKEENPDCSVGDISKKISSRWEKIDPVERNSLEVQYQREKEEYEKAKLRYETSLTNDQKAALQEEKMRLLEGRAKKKLKNKAKEHERPKKPPSSYILYSMTRTEARGNTPITEWQKTLSKEWSLMHESQKEKYVNEAKRLKLNYARDLKKWEERMISLGHVDLVRTEVLEPKTKDKVCPGSECQAPNWGTSDTTSTAVSHQTFYVSAEDEKISQAFVYQDSPSCNPSSLTKTEGLNKEVLKQKSEFHNSIQTDKNVIVFSVILLICAAIYLKTRS